MNEYKEVLNYIISNPCTKKYKCETCRQEKECEILIGETCCKNKKSYQTLQKLIEEEENFRWHDVQKNPSDLPEINSIVVFAHLCIGEKIGYSLTKYDSNYVLTNNDIAWSYVKKFEI